MAQNCCPDYRTIKFACLSVFVLLRLYPRSCTCTQGLTHVKYMLCIWLNSRCQPTKLYHGLLCSNRFLPCYTNPVPFYITTGSRNSLVHSLHNLPEEKPFISWSSGKLSMNSIYFMASRLVVVGIICPL